MNPRLLLAAAAAACTSAAIPDQDWGYVPVRSNANMFWWLYGANSTTTPRAQAPIILWLQGGPGGSSTGFGNFGELGPLDENLNYRNTTWLQLANLLFIDQPVGTGYSYVTDPSAYATNNTQLSNDVITLLTAFTAAYPEAQSLPFFIFCESYGGKMTTGIALAILAAVDAGHLKLNLRGIALGDSWISPLDYVQTWGPFLHSTSILDQRDVDALTTGPVAECTQAVANGQWAAATNAWGDVENMVESLSDGTDFYNILIQGGSDGSAAINAASGVSGSLSSTSNRLQGARTMSAAALALAPEGVSHAALQGLYRRHVVQPYILGRRYSTALKASARGGAVALGDPLDTLMNGPIRTQLNSGPKGAIIPANVTWGGQSDAVFSALSGDFMVPIVDGVDTLLDSGRVNVTVYTGQLDLICCTVGTETWMTKLAWPGMTAFYQATKTPQYPFTGAPTGGFRKAADPTTPGATGLTMWYVLMAGHMVPSDNGGQALAMVADILARQS